MQRKRFDPDSLQELIDAHEAALTLYARQWCSAPEDAVQDAFLQLINQPVMPDCPAAWLYKVVRRIAMNVARGDRRRSKREQDFSRDRSIWFEHSGNAFESGELETMLQTLPQIDREVVVAKIWGGLTFDEIAGLVNLSSSSAHRHYQDALTQLQKLMNPQLLAIGDKDESQ